MQSFFINCRSCTQDACLVSDPGVAIYEFDEGLLMFSYAPLHETHCRNDFTPEERLFRCEFVQTMDEVESRLITHVRYTRGKSCFALKPVKYYSSLTGRKWAHDIIAPVSI